MDLKSKYVFATCAFFKLAFIIIGAAVRLSLEVPLQGLQLHWQRPPGFTDPLRGTPQDGARSLGSQVWPLTQFFSVTPFCAISFIYLEGKSITPGWGNALFCSVPFSNTLVSVSDPWRILWADKVPFKGPRLVWCIASRTTGVFKEFATFYSKAFTIKLQTLWIALYKETRTLSDVPR